MLYKTQDNPVHKLINLSLLCPGKHKAKLLIAIITFCIFQMSPTFKVLYKSTFYQQNVLSAL